MSNLRTHLQIHNKYELELYDANGNIKDKAYAYNVVTNTFWNTFFGNGSTTSHWFRYIGIGTGTGTPSIIDGSFFKFLASAEATLVSKDTKYPTTTLVQKATFGASASLVGTLTEVGFTIGSSSSSSQCLTHAMLQDAEGNTITIEKTDTDVLIVTATLYVTVTADESFELVPANSFGLFSALRGSGINSGNTVGYLYPAACPALPTLSSLQETYIGTNNGSATTRSRNIPTTRMPLASGQRNGIGTYINCMFVSQFGGTRLPNAEFFPAYTLQPMSVGTGDGVTTEFVCPIPDFIEGTEEVVVDGVKLTNGVDYTVDSKGNSALNASSVNAHSNFAKSISNGGKSSSGGGARVLGTAGFSGPSEYGVYPKSTAPLVFDMGKDVECNALFIDGLLYKTNYSTTYTVPIVLEYSSDNETWAEAARLSMTAIGYGYSDRLTASDKNKLVRFDSITARYWRLYADSTQSYIKDYGVGSAYGNSFFGKIGQGIVFTNPPAEGAVITIAANVDRPFKTADYVIDYSATLYW